MLKFENINQPQYYWLDIHSTSVVNQFRFTLRVIFARYQFFNPVQLFLRHVFSYEAAFSVQQLSTSVVTLLLWAYGVYLPNIHKSSPHFFVQGVCSSHSKSAYILSSHMLAQIAFGASVTQQLSIISSNTSIKYLIHGIALLITGRIVSQIQTKEISGLDALCVSSFCNIILDCGYISFISSVGLVGVKVSIFR